MLKDPLAGILATPLGRAVAALAGVAIVAIAVYFVAFSGGGTKVAKNSPFRSQAAAAQSAALDKLNLPPGSGSSGAGSPAGTGFIDTSGNDGVPTGLGSAVAAGALTVDGSSGGAPQALADTGSLSSNGSSPSSSSGSSSPNAAATATPSGSNAAVPTTAPGEPTNTPAPGAPTATSVPTTTANNATATSVPAATSTSVSSQPTSTPVAPTATTSAPTATSVPPTSTSIPPTATTVPPTATNSPVPTPCGGPSASLTASPSSVIVGSPNTITLTASGFGCSEQLSATLSSSLGTAGPYNGTSTPSGGLSVNLPVSVPKATVCSPATWSPDPVPPAGTSLSIQISVTGTPSGKHASTSVTFKMPTC